MPTVPAFLSARAMRWLNVAVAIWAAFWIAIAVYVGYEVNALHALSDTVVTSGAAVETAGHALQSIGGVPLVGGQVKPLADQVTAAGVSAQQSGVSSKTTIDQLAVLLGIAIGLIPTLPLLALYVPLRRSWKRDRKAVEEALRRWHGEPELEQFLARRALAYLPYHELREAGGDGRAPSEDGGRSRLAAAELKRLGLDRDSRRVRRLHGLRERVGR